LPSVLSAVTEVRVCVARGERRRLVLSLLPSREKKNDVFCSDQPSEFLSPVCVKDLYTTEKRERQDNIRRERRKIAQCGVGVEFVRRFEFARRRCKGPLKTIRTREKDKRNEQGRGRERERVSKSLSIHTQSRTLEGCCPLARLRPGQHLVPVCWGLQNCLLE